MIRFSARDHELLKAEALQRSRTALLGITGLTGKVMKIIKKVLKKVDKVINKLIAKAGKLFKRGKGKGKDGKAETGVTDADKKKHQQIGDAVEKEMKKPPKKKGLTFEEFYDLKVAEARKLEKKYQPKLRGNVKIKITTKPVAQEKKDNDIDFHISIAPNDYKKDLEVKSIPGLKMSEFEPGENSPATETKEVIAKKMGKLQPAKPKYPQAYQGQVVGTPKSTLFALPMKYKREAFSSEEEAEKRFGLAIGMNKFEDVAGENAKKLKAEHTKFNTSQKYPIAVVGFLWSPNWRQKVDGKWQNRSVADVRKQLKSFKGEARTTALDQIAKAEKAMFLQEGSKFIPYGMLRDKLAQHRLTSALAADLRKNADDVYVHTGDPDGVSLKVSGSADASPSDMFKNFDKPLFAAYDEIIKRQTKNIQGKGMQKPVMVSGGYRFVVDINDDQKGQLGAIAAQIDQAMRQAMAKIDPSLVYFPEPNTIVKLKGNKLEVSFGVGSSEGATFMKKMIKEKGLTPEEMAFMSEAAIATDGGRFYAKMDDGKAATGQVLMYISGSPASGPGITQEQFRAIFNASQQSATAKKFANSFASGPKYFDSTDGNAKTAFRNALPLVYNELFPHTAILGGDLKDNTKWLNFVQELSNFPKSVTQAQRSAIKATFDLANATGTGLTPDQKTDEVVNALQESSSDITAYLKRLFNDTNPI